MQPKTKQVAVSFMAQESHFKAVENATKKVNEWLQAHPGATVVNTSLAVIEPSNSPAYAYILAVFEVPA